jgi:hypothetical protein
VNLPDPEGPAPLREEAANPAFPEGPGRTPGKVGPVGRGNNPWLKDPGAGPNIAELPDPDLPDEGTCPPLLTLPYWGAVVRELGTEGQFPDVGAPGIKEGRWPDPAAIALEVTVLGTEDPAVVSAGLRLLSNCKRFSPDGFDTKLGADDDADPAVIAAVEAGGGSRGGGDESEEVDKGGAGATSRISASEDFPIKAVGFSTSISTGCM